jgi:DNA polymerase
MCRLPGDHYISYPQARIDVVETEYGTQRQLTALKANWKPKADDTEWPRYKLWRGLLAENVDQAFCAALLRHSIRQVDDAVLHCHDEIGLEVPEEKAQAVANHLQMVMQTPPEWAQGLPLAAKPNIMKRYGK